jgi:hypothetical protein
MSSRQHERTPAAAAAADIDILVDQSEQGCRRRRDHGPLELVAEGSEFRIGRTIVDRRQAGRGYARFGLVIIGIAIFRNVVVVIIVGFGRFVIGLDRRRARSLGKAERGRIRRHQEKSQRQGVHAPSPVPNCGFSVAPRVPPAPAHPRSR